MTENQDKFTIALQVYQEYTSKINACLEQGFKQQNLQTFEAYCKINTERLALIADGYFPL